MRGSVSLLKGLPGESSFIPSTLACYLAPRRNVEVLAKARVENEHVEYEGVKFYLRYDEEDEVFTPILLVEDTSSTTSSQ